MTKALLIILLLSLNACARRQDIRPQPIIQSEQIMQQGLKFYRQDSYIQAIQTFNKALLLYQSFDDQNGILLAKINLIESALAISLFDLAKQTLDSLPSRMLLDESLKNKVLLLTAHSFFLQENYEQALKTIQPLLSQLPEINTPLSRKQINLLLTQTKFAIFAQSAEASQWFEKLNKVILDNSQLTISQQALFKRLAAHIALQKEQHQQAIALMQQSINLYKTKANRRAIATCLEEMAQIYLAKNNYPAARERLTRALAIRQWLKDQYRSTDLINKLKRLSIEHETTSAIDLK